MDLTADVKLYTKNKGLGLWEVVKTGKGIALKQKRFDTETGLEVEPVFEYIDIPALQKKQTQLNKQITNIATLLSDITTVNI